MNRTPVVVVLHIIIILLAYSAPFWLDWRLVALGVVVNYIQILIIGGCVLSHAQFEDKGQTFHEWYLKKFGLKVNRKILNRVLRYVVPFVLLGSAVLIQVVFDIKVLLAI